jgi:hypothetical protein
VFRSNAPTNECNGKGQHAGRAYLFRTSTNSNAGDDDDDDDVPVRYGTARDPSPLPRTARATWSLHERYQEAFLVAAAGNSKRQKCIVDGLLARSMRRTCHFAGQEVQLDEGRPSNRDVPPPQKGAKLF